MKEYFYEYLKNRRLKPLKDKYAISETLYPYHHMTFNISSLNEYIEIVIELQKVIPPNGSSNIFFRGMADMNWEPIPSIARSYKLEVNEAHLIKEFKNNYPEDFIKSSTNFELLANMQHYGLPTRLLDFTYNPLIALYFSCCDVKNNNGRVFCLLGPRRLAYSMAEILSDIACDPLIHNKRIEEITKKHGLDIMGFLTEVYSFPNTEIMERPPYWNERQRRQGSVFLVFKSIIKDIIAQNNYYSDTGESKNLKQLQFILQHENFEEIYQDSPWNPDIYFTQRYPDKKPLSFIVTNDTWQRLRKYYDTINDNTNTLVEKMNENFLNRFAIQSQIAPLEDDTLFNNCCSFIVSKKSKVIICRELEILGIDKAFIYPEKEYMANKIKDYYSK